MRKLGLVLATLAILVTNLFKAQNVVVHNGENNIYYSSISEVDSIKLANDITSFYLTDDSYIDLPLSLVDSLTFSSSTPELADKIYIIYNDDDVTVLNPFSDRGIDITTSGADVTVSAASGIADVEYNILGSSSDGSLSLTSDQNVLLILNNLSLTSASGTPFNIAGGITSTLQLTEDSENTIIDSSNNTAKASIVSDGALVFEEAGILNVTGNVKHAILSSSTITVSDATINIISSASDGFHSEGFTMDSGTLNITNTSGDGIDAGATDIVINDGTIIFSSDADDIKAIKTDGAITINDGDFTLTLTGDQSKGLSSTGDITVNGGDFEITLSGATVLEESGSGYDPSYSTAVKTDGNIEVTDATFNITLTDTSGGGKGFSADGNIVINSGDITIETNGSGITYTNEEGATDSYSAACFKADGNVEITGGTLNLTSNGSGGKGINADGDIVIGNSGGSDDDLTLNVTTTGERFYVSGSGDDADYANPKAVKAAGDLTVESGTIGISCTQSEEGGEGLESKATLTINGGLIEIETYDDAINASDAIIINGGKTYAHARNNDGIDSNGTLTVTGGLTIASGAASPEAGFDCDQNTFTITGGILIGTGGGTSSPTTSTSTQRSIKFTTTASNSVNISTGSTNLLTFTVPAYSSTSTGGSGGPGGNTGSSVVVLFSSSSLVSGTTYTLKRGGTISGGTDFHGYVTDGTYSGGTSTTFTASSIYTTVN